MRRRPRMRRCGRWTSRSSSTRRSARPAPHPDRPWTCWRPRDDRRRGEPVMYQTDMYEGMLAETVTMHGAGGDVINAYFARPLGSGPAPGVVVIHHLPGWDEWYREATRRFAHHGYAALSPNLYVRNGHGSPEDVAAKVRAEGGVPDDQVMGDVEGAVRFLRSLPYLNGNVGVFGTCSGGRHAYLAACRLRGFD